MGFVGVRATGRPALEDHRGDSVRMGATSGKCEGSLPLSQGPPVPSPPPRQGGVLGASGCPPRRADPRVGPGQRRQERGRWGAWSGPGLSLMGRVAPGGRQAGSHLHGWRVELWAPLPLSWVWGRPSVQKGAFFHESGSWRPAGKGTVVW